MTDCSVTSSWFLPDESSSICDKLLAAIESDKIELLLPDLWWYETNNVLRTSVKRKRLTPNQARNVLHNLARIPARKVSSESQGLEGILRFAIEDNLSAYDATYLHLAWSTDCDLVTTDNDLLNLKSKYPWITHPKDFPFGKL